MSDPDVILIEDDRDVRLGCLQTLDLEGLGGAGYASVEQARKHVGHGFRGVVVCDVRLPGADGLDYLHELQQADPDLPVVLITGHGDIAMAVGAMRDGAYDFLSKPFPPRQLVDTVQHALEKRRLALEVRQLKHQLATFGGLESRLIGYSPAMVALRALVQDIAPTPADVLIFGETGTGKELLARCIHDLSGRHGPFVALNCGGLSESLFDNEIFGHEAGAFSGAGRQHIGKIEYAQHGTLFLDEIESMPLAMQVKFLRVLQERVIERLGSNRVIPVDFRVIAATKADLGELSAHGAFRADLYFRLNVVTLKLPALRARREDILLLFERFVEQAAVHLERPAPAITAAARQQLLAAPWPGNVRELRNQAERFVLGLPVSDGSRPAGELPLGQAVEAYEKGLIQDALAHSDGNLSRAAEALQVAKTTLFDKVRKYALKAG